MKNKIELKFQIHRDSAHNVRVELHREGSGDDLVEARADQIEQAVRHFFRTKGADIPHQESADEEVAS